MRIGSAVAGFVEFWKFGNCNFFWKLLLLSLRVRKEHAKDQGKVIAVIPLVPLHAQAPGLSADVKIWIIG
jgi:hypothetical protein